MFWFFFFFPTLLPWFFFSLTKDTRPGDSNLQPSACTTTFIFNSSKDFTHVNYKSYHRPIKRFIFTRSSIKKGERLAKITPQRAGGVGAGSKNKKVPKSLRQILTSSCFFLFCFKLQKQNRGRENHSLFIQFHLSFPLVLKHPQKNPKKLHTSSLWIQKKSLPN